MSRHRAIDQRNDDGSRECRVCGGELVGEGPILRHEGEDVVVVAPERADARSFGAAVDAVEAALHAAPHGASQDDVAREVAQQLYLGGFLRRAPRRPRPRGDETVAPSRYEVERPLARVS